MTAKAAIVPDIVYVGFQNKGDECLTTLDDIARTLGVSKSTVSKALSGAKDVSKVMRQAVLEKAVEMGTPGVSAAPICPDWPCSL